MKAQYNITFPNNPEYNAEYEITIEKSGSFKYGNGTCIVVKRNNTVDEVIDTRYENIIDFDAWCDNYMAQKFRKELHPSIERI